MKAATFTALREKIPGQFSIRFGRGLVPGGKGRLAMIFVYKGDVQIASLARYPFGEVVIDAKQSLSMTTLGYILPLMDVETFSKVVVKAWKNRKRNPPPIAAVERKGHSSGGD